jgi:sugar lactone lactonase YvrE
MAPSFLLNLNAVDFVGHDLMRPECVLATRDGRLYCSDWRGGVLRIDPSGEQQAIGCAARREDTDFMPNGIALLRDRSLLVANLGPQGGVWRLREDGSREPWLQEIAGEPVPAVNFVWLDALERVWITVMFRSHPGAGRHHFRADLGDGYLAVADSVDRPQSTRIVAHGLFTPNECRISADGHWMYLNETFSHRVVRYRLTDDANLTGREVFAQFDEDTLPDGLTLDAEGAVWVTAVASNRIIRILADGNWYQVAEDNDAAHMTKIRAAINDGTLDRTLLYKNPARVLPNLTSLAFGGPDLRTAYLGSVSGTRIGRFRSPVAGAAPVHWTW